MENNALDLLAEYGDELSRHFKNNFSDGIFIPFIERSDEREKELKESEMRVKIAHAALMSRLLYLERLVEDETCPHKNPT